MAKAKDIRIDDMISVSPVGDNQKKVFEHYKKGKNMFLYGAAGTGKTFISLYLALQECLKNDTKYDTVYLVRSAVPTREIGFLTGRLDARRLEKSIHRKRLAYAITKGILEYLSRVG